jgi:hypothetical protein
MAERRTWALEYARLAHHPFPVGAIGVCQASSD